MRYQGIIILSSLLLKAGIGLCQQPAINKIALGKLFKTPNKNETIESASTWYAPNDDSLFYKSDTVCFYKDINLCYHCMAGCEFIEWEFQNSEEFRASEVAFNSGHLSASSIPGNNKIKIKEADNQVKLLVYTYDKLRNTYKILSLEYTNAKQHVTSDSSAFYKMTLLRLKNERH